MSQKQPKTEISLLCDVCERHSDPEDRSKVTICKQCANPKRVRVFNECCKTRLDLSLQEAHELYKMAGLDIWRTGVVLRFKECPDCAKDQVTAPQIFTINVPDSELEFFHAAQA